MVNITYLEYKPFIIFANIHNVFISDNKAPHKHLRGGVEFVAAIPKTPSGKILRRAIREASSKKVSTKSKL